MTQFYWGVIHPQFIIPIQQFYALQRITTWQLTFLISSYELEQETNLTISWQFMSLKFKLRVYFLMFYLLAYNMPPVTKNCTNSLQIRWITWMPFLSNYFLPWRLGKLSSCTETVRLNWAPWGIAGDIMGYAVLSLQKWAAHASGKLVLLAQVVGLDRSHSQESCWVLGFIFEHKECLPYKTKGNILYRQNSWVSSSFNCSRLDMILIWKLG